MSQQPNDQAPVLSMEECPHCGELVPVGTFCGNCGGHLSDEGGRARLHHFAAAPGEHVARTAVISTLFPHLPQKHAHIFREALGIGLLLVVLLAALRLFAPALLAAAVLLPVLYLLYLYEVEVYEQEPVLVLAATFVTGIALGIGYTLVVGHLFTGSLTGTQQGPILTGVLLPIVMQALMLAGPLLLLSHAAFDETLDGLTFGAASALGFTMAAVITGYWHVLTAPLTSNAISTEQIASIFRAAILAAIVNSSTTGAAMASIWLQHHSRSRLRHVNAIRDVPATLLIAFGAQIVLGVVSYFVTSILLLLALWAIAAAALLIWLRIIIHFALLEEGAELRIGEPSACPECHRLVPTMLFCPACGVARSAAPKHARGQPMEATSLAH